MTPEQKAQEEKWADDLRKCQLRFKARVMGALRYRSSKAKRSAYYQLLKAEIGPDLSREVAKFAEGAIAGSVRVPNWFALLEDNFIDVPTVSNK